MQKQWSAVITPKRNLLDLNLKEVWKYRDLIKLNVKRDFKTRYKQTVLGPLWFVIQPLLSSLVHTLVFGTIAGLSTDGVPQYLFYLSGSVAWGIFSACLSATSNTFSGNAALFSKVYFPRLVTPVSTMFTQLGNFIIQFSLYLIISLVFFLSGNTFSVTWVAALTPLIVIQMALLGTGLGVIISSLTTKYRDLQMLVSFGVHLLMYLSPVVYSSNSINSGKLYAALMFNPVSPLIELLRYGWLGAGSTPWAFWGISWIVTAVILFIGILIFNKIEKNFLDTV